jgi:hypothetical protein
MAITLRTPGTWVAATTNPTVTLPTHQAGDMLLVRVTWKSDVAASASATVNTAGWTKIGQGNNGTTNSSNGGGSVFVAAFYKIATSSSETAPTVEFADSNPNAVVAMAYQKASTEMWVTPTGNSGPDTTSGTTHIATIATHIRTYTGDVVDFFTGIADDTTMTVPTFTQAGTTLNAVTESPATALTSTTGFDIAADGGYRTLTAGTSTAAAVVTSTTSTAETGTSWMTRLRVTAPPVAQAQAQIKGSPTRHAQAQASIKAFGVNRFAQAQTRIVAVGFTPNYWIRLNSLNKATYGNNTWVAADASGNIWTASDPYGTWTQGSGAFGGAVTDIAYGDDGYWLASSGTTLAYTTNPAGAWTTITHVAVGTINAIAYGASGWVAVGDNSTTGSNQINVSGIPSGTWNDGGRVSPNFIQAFDVAFGNGIFVYGADGGFIHVSGTGNIDISAYWGSQDPVSAVTYSSNYNLWVLGADSSRVLYASTPTGAWDIATKSSAGQVYANALSEGNGWFVLVDEAGVINYITSLAGGSWNTYSLPAGNEQSNSTAYANGVWVTTYGYNLYASSILKQGFAQAQASISVFTQPRGFGQAQALIKQTYNGFAQAQALTNTGFTQLIDTGSRTASNGWGTPDTGPVWSTAFSASAGRWSVGSGTLQYTLVTAQTDTIWSSQLYAGDHEGRFDYKTTALPVGSASNSILTRSYPKTLAGVIPFAVRFTVTNTGATTLAIDGDGSQYISVAGPTVVAGTTYTVRWQVINNANLSGVHVRAKMWETGTAEPEWIVGYSIPATDPIYFAPGAVGIRLTNVANQIVHIDNINIAPTVLHAPAQAQASIKQTYRGYAQAQTLIAGAVASRVFAQAQAQIKQTYPLGGNHAATVRSRNPLAWWRLDETSGTVANDEIGTADGIYENTPTLNQPGLISDGTSVSLSKASLEWINVPTGMPAGGSVGVSLEAWFELASFGGDGNYYTIVSWTNLYSAAHAELLLAEDATDRWFYFRFHDGTTQRQPASQNINWVALGDTLHVVVTRDYASQTTKFYVNGVEIGTGFDAAFPTVALAANTRLSIGKWWGGDSRPFDGTIDEVAIYDYALTASDVKALFATKNDLTNSTLAQAQALIAPAGATTYSAFAQAQAHIKKTDVEGFAQANAWIEQTYNGFAQAQTWVEVTANRFAQSQAQIKQTYNAHAQAQTWVEVTANRHAQSQAWIEQTYNRFAQAQTQVKTTYVVHAQAQAQIKTTYNQFAQSQAWIEQTYNGFAQSQAWIEQAYNGFAQAQTWVEQTYNGFAQAQTQVKQTYNGYAQAQTKIATTRAYAQAETWIETTTNNFAQANAYIKGAVIVSAQAQTWVEQTYVGHAQAQADIKQTYNVHSQAQAWIENAYNAFAQAGAWIENTYVGCAQAQTQIKTTYNAHANAQAWIETTYNQFAQGQAWIKNTYNGHAQAQAKIATTRVFAQAQGWIETTTNSHGQAQCYVRGQTTVSAQAQTSIKTRYNAFAQAQADIKQTYNAHAQAGAWIEQTYNGYAQSQAQVKQTYNGFGQANTWIETTYNGFGQSQTWIEVTTNQSANAQAQIKQYYNNFAQAQAKINAYGVTRFAQAQALVGGVSVSHAQAQAKINAYGVNASAQAQASIKRSYLVFAQAQTTVKTNYQSYAQAQADIKQTYFAFAQSQAQIKQGYLAFAQAQAIVKQTYKAHSQAQATVKAVSVACGQAQTLIGVRSNGFGQAQTSIKATAAGYGQAQADIKATYNRHAQAQALVKSTYLGHAQANARITIAGLTASAQAQTQIKQGYLAFANAQTTILAVSTKSANAQALIKTTVINIAQAQAYITTYAYGFGQAQAVIQNAGLAFAQAQAHIVLTGRTASAQAQAMLIKAAGYGQAQAFILQPNFVKHVEISTIQVLRSRLSTVSETKPKNTAHNPLTVAPSISSGMRSQLSVKG